MRVKVSTQPWVILFGGVNRQGVLFRLREIGIKIKATIVPKTKNNNRLDKLIHDLRELDFNVRETSRDAVDETLRQWSDCVLLSIGFPYLLSKSVIDRHKFRLNIHPTLLPKYRGPTTGAFILINGEKESGSTVHILEEEMDAGDIVAQSCVQITKFDTVRSLQRKVYESEPDLIEMAIKHLDNGLPLKKQNESEATVYPIKRKPIDSKVDPDKTLNQLFDEIRACDPDNYAAFFMVNRQKVCIRLWRPDKPSEEDDMI